MNQERQMQFVVKPNKVVKKGNPVMGSATYPPVSNYRIQGYVFACDWITIVRIVICLVLQRVPTVVKWEEDWSALEFYRCPLCPHFLLLNVLNGISLSCLFLESLNPATIVYVTDMWSSQHWLYSKVNSDWTQTCVTLSSHMIKDSL